MTEPLDLDTLQGKLQRISEGWPSVEDSACLLPDKATDWWMLIERLRAAEAEPCAAVMTDRDAWVARAEAAEARVAELEDALAEHSCA